MSDLTPNELPNEESWPLNQDSSLPSSLFPDSYLEEIFFRAGPQVWGCTAQVVRRAFKALAKRPVGVRLQQPWSKLKDNDRDRALASYICNNARTRMAIEDVELIRESAKGRSVRTIRGFAESVWYVGYTKSSDAALVSLSEWAMSAAQPREGSKPDAVFLTPSVLASALESSAPCVALTDISFARMLVLFASFLDRSEAVELLETGYSHGCTPLGSLLSHGDPTSPAKDSGFGASQGQPGDVSPGGRALPRILVTPADLDVPTVSQDARSTAIAADVLSARLRFDETASSLGPLGNMTASAIAALPGSDFTNSIAVVSALHDRHTDLAQAVRLGEDYVREGLAYIESRIGYEVGFDIGDGDRLVADVGLALPAATSLQSRGRYFSEWLASVGTPIPLSRIRELSSVQSNEEAYRASVERFRDQLFVALPGSCPNRVADWMDSLTADEYSSLFLAVEPSASPVLSSLLIALGLERFGSGFAEMAFDVVSSVDNGDIRRSLLRFVDPSSATVGHSPRLARLVVRERLYDLFGHGSLNAVADLGATAFDPSFVGHSVSAAIQTIMSSLSITDSLPRLQALVTTADRMPTGTAASLAIEFIEAPVGLNGHFRRLRERARETVFVPLIQDGSLNTRLASGALREIENGNHEHQVWRSVEETLPAGGKLESQHRTQLKRYLENGRRLLEAAVRASGEMSKAHEAKLGAELGKLIEQMPSSGEVGTETWLESEFRSLFLGGPSPSSTVALVNNYYWFNDQPWSSGDSRWAVHYGCLAEFYELEDVLAKSVLVKLLLSYTVLRPEAISTAFSDLLKRGLYSSASRLLEEQARLGHSISHLRKHLDSIFDPIAADIMRDLSRVKDEYSDDLVQATSSFARIIQSLKRFDHTEAREQIGLLEIELLDAKQQAERDADLARQAIESSEVLARLIRAGAADVAVDLPLAELRQRWERELSLHTSNRQHLISAHSIVSPLRDNMPEFAPLQEAISLLERQLEDPDAWLKPALSEGLADFLSASTKKLRSWAEAATILDQVTRRSLSSLIVTFLRFLQEQADAARGVDDTSTIDGILEQAMELDSAIADGADPSACLSAAAEILGLEAVPASSDLPEAVYLKAEGSRQTGEGFAIAVASAVAAKAWSELKALGTNARGSAADDEVARIDEVIDFSRAMLALADRDGQQAYDLLDGATRAVVSAGHPVYRALSSRDRLGLPLEFLITALEREAPREVQPDAQTRWASLVLGWPTLFRSVGEGDRYPQASRVLEYIFSSSLAFEASDMVWTAAAGLPEPSNTRSDLLRYLHDLRQSDAISRLCGRYDRSAQVKVEQMLGLRNVASSRPDLLPAAEALAVQAIAAAKSAAIRAFVRGLPTAAPTVEGRLTVSVQDDILIRNADQLSDTVIQIPLSISAHGVVPTRIQAHLFQEDDVSFSSNNGRLLTLSEELLYVPKDFVVGVRFGDTWAERLRSSDQPTMRIRFAARTLTDTVVSTDVVCPLSARSAKQENGRRIDRDTLLEYYPGVGNTPAEGENFVGRHADLEQLTSFLVAARHPSPILLTGMRRVGKTSLLYAFHRRHARPADGHVLTVYLSIAEKRNSFMLADQTVSSAFFRAITRSLAKPFFPEDDQNRLIGERLREVLGSERNVVRAKLEECFDPESLADSLMHLSEKVVGWLGGPTTRLVFLVDEAESLVVPYNHGGSKRMELDQLLQSLREVSQTTGRVGLVLSGSNHINAFAREYKNAFFGSCVRMDLRGITDFKEASLLISPARVAAFVQIEASAVAHGVELCAGMPQFMWQLGAATTWSVRSGSAVRADVRAAMSTLIAGGREGLPFQPYDVLEPIEHMLKLQGDREQDLLWLLLRRVATSSSLAAVDAPRHFLLDQSLLDLDGRETWNKRLANLIDLAILVPTGNSSVRFAVPLFAEAFRSSRMEHENAIRLQRVSA